MSEPSRSSVSPALVGISAWLVPGSGYFLIGQRARAITVFVTIVALFLVGIIIGGIRIMDPPGWGQYGYMDQLIQSYDKGHQEWQLEYTKVEPNSADQANDPRVDDHDQTAGPALLREPITELGDKPWYVGQILCGPITLAASAISVNAAHPTVAAPSQEGWPSSHSRSWEIGALYTAVAGMLNLLVIIDSAARAAQLKTFEKGR
jgi:hypothetical protein